MSDIDQVILELKCLGEVAEVEGMTVEGNALHPIINIGWQSLDHLRAEVASLKEELRTAQIALEDATPMIGQNAYLTQQLAAANGRVDMLKAALNEIVVGDVRNTPKADQCIHGRYGFEECENCYVDYAQAALSNLNEDSVAK